MGCSGNPFDGAAATAGPETAITAVSSSTQDGLPSTPSGWTVTFSDDFVGSSGTAPSTERWQYVTGTSYPGGAANFGTGEIETMTSSTANVYLDGSGHLAIKPVRNSAGQWTSGRLESQRTDFAAPEGGKMRVEGRLQLPNVSGAAASGYWPAFWLLGDAARPVGASNWPAIGEIDIMENVNGMESIFSTLHCGTVSGGPCNETSGLSSGQFACVGCNSSFHTFAVEHDRSVSPEQLRWYLDGDNFFTLDATKVDATTWTNATRHGFFIILNVAMGGGFPAAFGGAATSATQSGAPLLVDYVAVYTTRATAGAGTSTGSAASGAGGANTWGPSAEAPEEEAGTTPPGNAGGGSATGPTTSSTRSAYSRIEAESFRAQSGTSTESTTDSGGGEDVGWIANGDWLQYDSVDFGAAPAAQCSVRAASGIEGGSSGLIEIRIDSRSSAPIATIALGSTGGWQTWRTIPINVSPVTGTHTVYLTFSSGQAQDFVNLNWFTCAR